MNIIKKNTALLDTRKEIGLEVNVEKAKYILCHITRMQDKAII
jgi:hypothetical protein